MIIKPYQSDFVAIKGSITVEKFGLASLEIPYWQVLKSKVDLSTGESYTISGIGDNHNFLMIRVYYDQRSSEPEQYLQLVRNNTSCGIVGQLYIETSNSSNRQNSLTVTNPSTLWTCQVEFLVSVIDNQKNFFGSQPNPTETTGGNYFNDIKSMNPTQIGIYSGSTLIAFVVINEIANYFIDQNNDTNLIIDDISRGLITVSFVDNWNCQQAFSALAWLLFSHETAMAMTKARAALGEVIKALETVTPEMVDAWEKADWIPEGKSFSDFTDEEASRLCCAANFAAILGASPLMKGQ